jgi:hypothetical protein
MIRAEIDGATAEISHREHPTKNVLTCDECDDTCTGDVAGMADFVIEHTRRHAEQRS